MSLLDEAVFERITTARARASTRQISKETDQRQEKVCRTPLTGHY